MLPFSELLPVSFLSHSVERNTIPAPSKKKWKKKSLLLSKNLLLLPFFTAEDGALPCHLPSVTFQNYTLTMQRDQYLPISN